MVWNCRRLCVESVIELHSKTRLRQRTTFMDSTAKNMSVATSSPLSLIAVMSCVGAQDQRCELGPSALKNFGMLQRLNALGKQSAWHALSSHNSFVVNHENPFSPILDLLDQIRATVLSSLQEQNQFCVLGGDHSCAIGTWNGVKQSLNPGSRLGLIWIDAHMDSHTPETSPSAAVHGMPLACLLGQGPDNVTNFAGLKPVLLPQDLCLIGVRSYEPEEARLLQQLGVKVFFMEDINRQGLSSILEQAKQLVCQHTDVFGCSIDIDAIDPEQAPGVGSPESNGIQAMDLVNALKIIRNAPGFVGAEIVEYNPAKDQNSKTASVVCDLAEAMFA